MRMPPYTITKPTAARKEPERGLQMCGLNRSNTQKELQPHGTIEFPCAAYASRHTDAPGDAIVWHWHEELEIIYITDGVLKLRIPGREYLLCKGELVVITGNMLHYLIGHPAGALRSIVFSPFLLTGGTGTAFYKKYVGPLLTCPDFAVWHTDAEADIRCFSDAFSALETDAFAYEFTVRENLSHLLLQCYERLLPQLSAPKAATRAATARIEKMLQYIQSSYAEPVTLAEIAKAAGLSERECLRCFHRTIGDSPVQYLLKYRLMRSAELLRAQPAAGIAEVAAACGFDSPSYFSRQFRRFYQCTPREYRTH